MDSSVRIQFPTLLHGDRHQSDRERGPRNALTESLEMTPWTRWVTAFFFKVARFFLSFCTLAIKFNKHTQLQTYLGRSRNVSSAVLASFGVLAIEMYMGGQETGDKAHLQYLLLKAEGPGRRSGNSKSPPRSPHDHRASIHITFKNSFSQVSH